MSAEGIMGTQELVAHGREQRAAQLRATVEQMREIGRKLTDPRQRAANEEHAHALEQMAARIEFGEVYDHAKGRA